ncbi:type II toxin-antitoxin system VapC family toxin [Acinetobacter sp. VNH17]|uniref:Type II toxin-antitoxin system VapC family toxin n=1 Tax=Acinetobacter thutiue TaxID=2998078 RepID=A0ABT7WQF9_9GAMM|nr:type II toxin-antitoxin system VapC family toxin [Acinetobacter thutiue]MCY6412791.1 type II toxin-antitoxin system VapC family toxin [Acinetobacter thutiue]MDN0014898.1 type II toxin-antitoxin system VapC family toxin [Acinetobacter thutiue]
MYLLDTNILSQIRKIHHPHCPNAFKHWFETTDLSLCYLSVITIFEIEQGILRKEHIDPIQGHLLRTWFEQKIQSEFKDRVLELNMTIALKTAQLHVPNPASLTDSMIGATALQHNLTLITRNTKDFQSFGVKLFNPFEA